MPVDEFTPSSLARRDPSSPAKSKNARGPNDKPPPTPNFSLSRNKSASPTLKSQNMPLSTSLTLETLKDCLHLCLKCFKTLLNNQVSKHYFLPPTSIVFSSNHAFLPASGRVYESFWEPRSDRNNHILHFASKLCVSNLTFFHNTLFEGKPNILLPLRLGQRHWRLICFQRFVLSEEVILGCWKHSTTFVVQSVKTHALRLWWMIFGFTRTFHWINTIWSIRLVYFYQVITGSDRVTS